MITFEGVSERRPIVIEVNFRFFSISSIYNYPFALEDCREAYADHTCDKRRPRSYIEQTFPNMSIEDGFTEEDERWTGSVETGETKDDVTKRAKRFLDRVFERDVETYE